MFNFLGIWPTFTGKPTAKKIAELENAQEWSNNFNDLYTRALNEIAWEGGPDSINWRFVEMCLLNDGQCIIAKLPDGYLALASLGTGSVNVYGQPVEAHGWGLNGFNKKFKLYIPGTEVAQVRNTASGLTKAATNNPEAVLCKDNPAMYPFINYILVASERITQAMRSADVIVENMKQPAIITCDESLVDTAVKVLKNRNRNHTAVLSTGSLNFDSVKVWKTDVDPQSLTAMWEHLERIESRVNETLGIDDASQIDKKERLLVDEVNANQEEVSHNMERRLEMRREFIEHLKIAFPGDFEDVTVGLRIEPEDDIIEGEDADPNGGNEDV